MRALLLLVVSVMLSACIGGRATLADLSDVELELKDEKIEGGLDKAMASYRKFLAETPEGDMTPEALRRLADLKIEQEYGYIPDAGAQADAVKAPKADLDKPTVTAPLTTKEKKSKPDQRIAKNGDETDKAFEKRMNKAEKLPKKGGKGFSVPAPEGAGDLENANARDAVRLYKKLLAKYPNYERNDQVLYQLSRAYEELGQVDAAMKVMNRFIKTYPNSRYMDEVQFRRAEYFFTRKKFLDSEDAYKSIVKIGKTSSYYELAVYKLGWSYYKQELYDDALDKYFALLDYKVSIGYDFDQQHDKTESKRIEDTFRVISLSFSNLGGADSVVAFFKRYGKRVYEEKVYSHLAEFYLDKRRYNDSAQVYLKFVSLYPFHASSPNFQMRVIDIYKKGGFGKLVIEQKKAFAEKYALTAEYWRYFDIKKRDDVVGFLKANIKDLANFYHARYQQTWQRDEKKGFYQDALQWYRSFLSSFPVDTEAPAIHFKMAELMLENKDFAGAAKAYDYTAYNYPKHEKSSEAAYASVYAWREELKKTPEGGRGEIRQKVIQSSLKFADTFPKHKKVTAVLGATADELYELRNYELALKIAKKLIKNFPKADKELIRAAWLVIGHASLDQSLFADAEAGYTQVLALTPAQDKLRAKVQENLAAAVYKQGEEANKKEDYKTAATHFLRVGELVPRASIRATAEYDGAAALIKLEDWKQATRVLEAFRKNFPGHKLQFEITKKIAYVYRSSGQLDLAANEYERIGKEAKDNKVRRGSLDIAAELYRQTGAVKKELALYERYVRVFPKPVDQAMDIYFKIASVYKKLGRDRDYRNTLQQIVKMDKSLGRAGTDRTKYLAAQATLVMTEDKFDRFAAIKLKQPFKKNLKKKKRYMQEAIKAYSKLVDFEVADVTAAATYYIAEIYLNFSRSLAKSERPKKLNAMELEQYELALEEQIYPFEEKAIATHKKNIELIRVGVFSSWIDKSIGRLGTLVPAMYARKESTTGFIDTIDGYRYVMGQEMENAATAGNEGDARTGDLVSQVFTGQSAPRVARAD